VGPVTGRGRSHSAGWFRGEGLPMFALVAVVGYLPS
jgi:hypothetical protein